MKIILFFLLTISLQAQTAQDIITQHLETSGGISNWKNLNSIILSGNASLDLNQSFPIKIYHRRPYEKKVVFIIDGKEVLNEGYDGKNGYTFSEISNKNEKITNYQPDSFESDLLDYASKGFEAKLVGQELIEKKTCYKVVLTKFKNKVTYFFDVKNYELLAEETAEETIYYYNYKPFNGLQFATKMIGKPKNGGEYVITFSSIKINPAINDKTFKF